MTAAVIGLGGGQGGDMFGPNKNNPKGMFENKTIREGVMKPYLRSIEADPMGQCPLPDIDRVWEDAKKPSFVKRWREMVLCALSSQIAESEADWFYKGAKMCLTWPLWHAAFPEAKWVLVRRSDSGTINSCMRTSFMRAYRSHEGWQSWIEEHKKRFNEMKASGVNLQEIWPEKAVEGNVDVFRVMMERLDMPFAEKEVREFIDPHLWRKR